MSSDRASDLDCDVAAIRRISAVPTILRTMCATTGLRFTLIARVTPDKWVACAVHDEINFGLEAGGELDVGTTLCREVRETLRPVLIDHVAEDAVYRDHPTPKMYGFQSYVAVPIFRRNGEYFGNICGLDPSPNVVRDGKTLATLELFSELISRQLDSEERNAQDRAELFAQQEASKLREQFIAVLGHDVRSPLSSIEMGIELLLHRVQDPHDRRVLERVRSSAQRISALVDDLLDLARGRLGGGIALELAEADDLVARLRHVVAEVQAAHPTRSIHCEAGASGPLRCDVRRMEQVLSNLLANAVEHGAARTPVLVAIGGDDQTFTLTVSNEGPPIPVEKSAKLFEPYFRGGHSGRLNGLGLGLFIVSEIARAHGGSVQVASSAERTSFVFSIPRGAVGSGV